MSVINFLVAEKCKLCVIYLFIFLHRFLQRGWHDPESSVGRSLVLLLGLPKPNRSKGRDQTNRDPCPVDWGNRIRQLHLCRGVRHPPTVGRRWRPVMLRDGVLVAEQSMTRNTPPWPLLELDGRSERPPPINRLVTSTSSTYDCPDPIALIANPQPI